MTVILDAQKLEEKEQAHRYLKQVMGFPDYYGNNLDALYDCLSEIPDLTICILHADQGQGYFSRVLSVFEDLTDAKVRYI